ncbi:YfcE family phosphodiesterase [Virgibacillus halophilus]|uniref:Phosphoesterase n=1 Tax=Tigheibacillus halophilus TaxID=361280 RepID=A0ABU5CC38_9BACI|nr:YfcE family phosphodiesterase [Virgibacillus halophilus]
MYKVLIVSDSHGLKEQLKQIKERHEAEYLLHCGDSELDMDEDAMTGFLKVRGNCDFDVRYPLEQTFAINETVFFIAHGHLHDVKMDLTKISYRGEELGANIVCFGHTHVAGVQKDGGPSINQSRQHPSS